MFNKIAFGLLAACALIPLRFEAQTPTNMAVLKGLAPVTALANTPAGRAALGANYTVTGGIQTGAIRQPAPLPAAVEAFHAVTQTYSLPVVYPETANVVEDVGKLAPEAGYLLTTAFASLTLDQANQILTETEGPGGGFLDNGSAFGAYSRLNLYAAARRAAIVASGK